jgi:hypothetical protein
MPEFGNPEDVSPGPIRYTPLPHTILYRIARLHAALHDVMPLSLEELIDQFRREQNPEKELIMWEAIARVYTAYTDRVQLNDDQRIRALRIILGSSVGMTVQQMADDLVGLPEGAAGQIAWLIGTVGSPR